MATRFEQAVWNKCRQIPKGRVSTYAEVSRAIGKPKAARAVGNALNKNPFASVPCHRVVCSDGRVGGFGRGGTAKVKKLRKEGVKIKNHCIADFEKKLFMF